LYEHDVSDQGVTLTKQPIAFAQLHTENLNEKLPNFDNLHSELTEELEYARKRIDSLTREKSEAEKRALEILSDCNEILRDRDCLVRELEEIISANNEGIQILEEQSVQDFDTISKLELEIMSANRLVTQYQIDLEEKEKQEYTTEREIHSLLQRQEEMKEKISCLEKFRSISHDMLMQISGNIRVYVRLRPQIGNQQEELNSINKCYNVLNDKIICRNRSMFSFPELDSQISTATCEMSTNEAWKTLLEIREPIRNYTGLKPRQKKWKFAFDRIFLPENKQNDVWNATEPLVQSFIDGHKVCIFTYGQTGSGKTYTMLGEPGSIETEGIIYRSARKIYAKKN